MTLRSLSFAFVTSPLLFVLLACGSSESDPPGGSSTCASGATQSCTCNGSDVGVQLCTSSGDGWGACQCNGSGGTGSVGASGGTGGSGGSTGGSGGTNVGGASSSGGSGPDGGAGSGPTDAGVDADYTPGPDDDPCPLEPIDINCSTSCGPRDAICDLLECNTASNPLQVLITKAEQLMIPLGGPFIIRLPAKPKGPCVGCNLPSDPSLLQAHASISFTQETGFGYALIANVGLPWRISPGGGVSGNLPVNCTSGGHGQCQWRDNFPFTFSFYTLDANAPARNAVISISSKDCNGQ
jgi:hypothetical protein